MASYLLIHNLNVSRGMLANVARLMAKGKDMVFEFVFPSSATGNGFSRYAESLASEKGLRLLDQFQAATIVEGEWESAMGFLRQCREYILERNGAGEPALTTVHIHT